MRKMHGGGKHRNKRNKVEQNPATNPQSQEPVRGQQEHNEEKITQSLVGHEDADGAVIRHFEESEETRKTIANLAKGNNSYMQRWIQTNMEWSGLDDEHKKTEGRQPTAAQEQDRRVCLAADEVQEARGWQENF